MVFVISKFFELPLLDDKSVVRPTILFLDEPAALLAGWWNHLQFLDLQFDCDSRSWTNGVCSESRDRRMSTVFEDGSLGGFVRTRIRRIRRKRTASNGEGSRCSASGSGVNCLNRMVERKKGSHKIKSLHHSRSLSKTSLDISNISKQIVRIIVGYLDGAEIALSNGCSGSGAVRNRSKGSKCSRTVAHPGKSFAISDANDSST